MPPRTPSVDWSFLFTCSHDGMLLLGPDARILDANPRACELLGYTRDELLRLSSTDLVAPEDVEVHRARLVAAAGSVLPAHERRMRRKDGTVVVMDGFGLPAGEGRVLGVIHDITARKQLESEAAEAAARLQEQMFRALIEKALDIVAIVTADGTIRYVSPAIHRVLGYQPESLIGRNLLRILHPHDVPAVQAALAETLARGTHPPIEVRLRKRGGGWRLLQGVATNRDDDPSIGGLVINARDVTEARLAEEALEASEEQLRHAQRLESIGRLAGGVAHDFNNLLTVILAYCEQQLEQMDTAHPMYRASFEIRRAADRAAGLTRQLLAFSRRQVLEPRVLDLNLVLADLGPMLQRLIGEDIDLHLRPGDEVGRVRADRGQIEQVLMNLVVNARDAMPEGGRLTIATGSRELDQAAVARDEALAAGRYSTLTVSDSGTGMDPETLAKLFEPFFTTKPRGEGTGLGLSMVYGIVQQSGGAVTVESEPGEGATFTVFLPVAPGAETEAEDAAAPAPRGGGNETVLLVEDESVVRDLISEILKEVGYEVLEAPGGRDALAMAAEFGGVIHLLLTDVVMPGMSGRELAQRLVIERPETRVLYVSGYTQDLIAKQGILEPGVQLLAKPFEPAALTRKVREVLDAPARRAA